ncbi:YjcZ family sporulation protein [Fictibacillus sp. Mic-4]|nr:YjcZ family sporulation protein [Fictibacillus gelatini]
MSFGGNGFVLIIILFILLVIIGCFCLGFGRGPC